jgi:hypothetical protein
MKEKINKDVSMEDYESIVSAIRGLEGKYLKEAKKYISIGRNEENGSLFTMDFFVSAVVNRSISNMRGYLTLIEENNYIAAIPLIRLQIDNCLAIYAAATVSDYDEFFMEFLKGTHIRNMKDSKNKNMTETYLSKECDKNVAPGIRNLYKNTSGYIHMSNNYTFLHTTGEPDGEDMKLQTKIGYLDFYELYQNVDFCYNMYKASEILLTLVKSWTSQKEKAFDKKG